MHAPIHPKITTRQVFAIAGPAMVANLTTPLIGIVSTTAIGRLDDAALLGGVAMASVIFDCLFWLFAFLRMSTLAFTAQAQGAGEIKEYAAILVRGFIVAGLIGAALIALQAPLATVTFQLMGGSAGVTHAAKSYFMIRIWSAPLALANYVILGWLVGQARANLALVLQIVVNLINVAATVLLVQVYGAGIAGAAIAAVLAEATGFAAGIIAAWRISQGGFAVPAATLFDRAKLMRMLAVNRDIMVRTAALIVVFLFFTAKGAREGDVTLAANSVLNNFLLVSAFFLDGLANAAQQLCGPGVRDPGAAARRVRVRLRRHLCRRDLGARDAQFDAGLARDLPRGLVGAQRIRQHRPVDRADRLLRRARRPAGPALSGAVQENVQGCVARLSLSCPGRGAARSDAPQSRDLCQPWAPDQQRTTPQLRRAALHPGHERVVTSPASPRP